MKHLIFLTLLFVSVATLGQVSDATGRSGANVIKNETATGANTALRVGTNFVQLWDSKGNKQEANTWTGLQTFSAGVLTGTGTPVTSGNSETVIYSGSAASGNRIATAINIRQSVASTGVFFGDYVKSYADHPSGTINQLLAIQGNSENAGAGTVTTARGVLGGTVTTNGPITNAVGVRAEGVFIAGSAAVSKSYGLQVTGATVGSGSVAEDYGIYQFGADVTNIFEGPTQFSPTSTHAGLYVGVKSGSDPSGSGQSQIYYNTTSNKLRFRDNSTWRYVTLNDGINDGNIQYGSSGNLADENAFDYQASTNTLTVDNITHGGSDLNIIGSSVYVKNATSNRVRVDGTGILVSAVDSGDDLILQAADQITISGVSLVTTGIIFSSTYTPTITAIANIDATTAYSCTYTRVGHMVTVCGQIDADATAAGSTTTRVRLSLPVGATSNFANPNEAGGSGNRPGSNPGDVGAYADPTNDQVILHWLSTGTGNQTITFIFAYQII